MISLRPRFCLISILFASADLVNAAPKPAKTTSFSKTSVAVEAKVKVAAPKVSSSKFEKPKIARPFRLIVPAMGIDIPVVSGIDNDALRLGPGHDPFSALPGASGNCVVASHRNVHGAYFWYLTRVRPGALITLQTPRETFTYRVVSAGVVPESQTDLLDNYTPQGAPARLTLYTCTLPVSPRRLVVVAHQISRGSASSGAFGRPAVVPEITSGPLLLLKDKTLHKRYKSRLRGKGASGTAKNKATKNETTKNEAAPVALSIEKSKVAATP